MATPNKIISDETNCPSPDILAVSVNKDMMFAAAFGKGIYHKGRDGSWTQADHGLPDGTIVNRMQSIDGSVYVCTNMGLFYYDANQWYATDVTVPCYQVKRQGVFFAAATEYGLWCKIGTRWENTAYPNTAIYDLLLTPQYYILATSLGLSLYDRYTADWAEIPLDTAIMSLSVYRGYLLGVTLDGDMIQGNKRGGFTKVSFEGKILYSLKMSGTSVYACTSQGLYRFEMVGARLILRSMLAGYPVTDVASFQETMYIAALNRGLKKIECREN